MSALLGHAIAARTMAEALSAEAEDCGDDANALLLARLAKAHIRASNAMFDKIIADAKALNDLHGGVLKDV